MAQLLVPQIIAKKRDQHALSSAELEFLVRGFSKGEIPDYQISAWAMAVLCRGMTAEETATLTRCMLESGSSLQRCTERPRVDKHSTGGLGDKVSLVLAPLLACFDLDVPMLSGRGLGITGGTLDKLESYAGFRCNLTEDEISAQLGTTGCVITGTTEAIAPADRKLYALRDVTGTVPSIPLITSSILSKKLAESLDALVLDVKVGSGSFMKTIEQAEALAASLQATSQALGLPASVVISDMNQPLGKTVGNACEANEAVQSLKGEGPPDLQELTYALAAQLLVSSHRADSLQTARVEIQNRIAQGEAFERYVRMIEAQGGTFQEDLRLASKHTVTAAADGWIHAMDGETLGNCIIEMGGGRRRQGDPIDHTVGLLLLKKMGDSVSAGEPLMHLYCDNLADSTHQQLNAAISVLPTPPTTGPLILRT